MDARPIATAMAPIAPAAVGRMDDWMGRVRVSCMTVSVASGLVVSRIAWLRWLLTQGMRRCRGHFFIRRRRFDESRTSVQVTPTDDVGGRCYDRRPASDSRRVRMRPVIPV
jgi:hypothetical protein